MNVAARVAESKAKRPWLFCPVHRCLWRTGTKDNSPTNPAPRCPRHP